LCAGSAINIPVARFRDNAVQVEPFVSVFGITYLVPVLRSRSTVVAVNAGGALVPAALSAYLAIHDRLGWRALAAVAIVAVLVHLVARPVPGLGSRCPRCCPGYQAWSSGMWPAGTV